MMSIRCKNCGDFFPESGFPFRCQRCGGIFGFDRLPEYNEKNQTQPGIWKYQSSFGMFNDSPVISLGEGSTPLATVDIFDRQVGMKLEYLNPTGSFKDRGTAILMSAMVERGIGSAIEDSSGNAGAAFSAYAARAGIKGKVFVPDYASAAKRKQISAYGSEVVRVLGKRSNASRVVKEAADGGEVYASHAYLPHGLMGFATIAFELYEQLGGAPGTVVAPVGQGGLFLGIGYGFQMLQSAGLIEHLPVLVGVQAMACAPLWAMSTQGPAGFQWVTEGETLAEGIRIKNPLRGDDVMKIAGDSRGFFVVVDEDQITDGLEQLGKLGFFIEPTSAVIWHSLKQVVQQTPEPVVAILTGSGYKNI